jgi:hypothetical protein
LRNPAAEEAGDTGRYINANYIKVRIRHYYNHSLYLCIFDTTVSSELKVRVIQKVRRKSRIHTAQCMLKWKSAVETITKRTRHHYFAKKLWDGAGEM